MSRPSLLAIAERLIDGNGFPYSLASSQHLIDQDTGCIALQEIYTITQRKALAKIAPKFGWIEKHSSGLWYITEAGRDYLLLKRL